MAKSSNNSEGLAGLLSAIMTQYASQQGADNAVDGKANNLMAAALVIIPLLGTQLIDGSGRWHWLVGLSMAVMVLTVPLVLFLTRDREYAGAVVDLGVHRNYFSLSDPLLIAQLIEDTNQANTINAAILVRKQELFRLTVFVFLGGFALGIVSLFLVH